MRLLTLLFLITFQILILEAPCLASVRVNYSDEELSERKEIEMAHNIVVDGESILVLIFKNPVQNTPRRNTCWIRVAEIQSVGFKTARDFFEFVRPLAPPVIDLKNRSEGNKNFCTFATTPDL